MYFNGQVHFNMYISSRDIFIGIFFPYLFEHNTYLYREELELLSIYILSLPPSPNNLFLNIKNVNFHRSGM